MLRYFLKKAAYAILVLIGVVFLLFFLFNVLGIDPGKAALDERSDAAAQEAIREKYGLNDPVYVRFGRYLTNVMPIWVHKNTPAAKAEFQYVTLFSVNDQMVLALKFPYLGRSLFSGRRVNEILGSRLVNTLILALTAMLFAIFIGIILGVLAAVNRDSWWDRTTLVVSSVGVSIPSYFSAILLSFLLGYALKEYTGLNMIGSLHDLRGHLQLKNLILPALALGIRPVAIITQLTRSSMLDVLGNDYIRTARAKGVSRQKLLFSHALRNGLNPVITSVSGWLASLLAGAYFVEVIFNFKGLGYETVKAIEVHDFTVVTGSVLLAAFIFVAINILVDLLYGWTDPRVKFN